MAIQLGSAYGKITLDVNGFMNGVNKAKGGMSQLMAAGEKLANGLNKVGNAMTVGITLPLAAIGAASIKAASDFEETKNKAVVVFGEMADSVVRNADRSATALGIGKTAYLDYASSIAAALKAGGMGVQESAALAEQAVQHFADLASFHNAQVQDVALAWQSAIRGQYEPIQKYFPYITNEYLKTYGIANGLIDENTTTLTANQRAIILNAIALNEQLNPAMNDFAETSDGLANQTRILKAQWQDALVLLGQNFLPVALQVVQALNSLLEKMNALSPVQQKMVLGFAGLLAITGPVLKLISTIITLVTSLSGLSGTLGGLGISFSGIGAALGTIGTAAAAALTPLLVIVAVIAAVAAQLSIFVLAWRNNFLNVRDAGVAAAAFIRNAWRALMAFLQGDTESAMEYMRAAFQALADHVRNVLGEGIVDNARQAWANFTSWIGSVLGNIRNYIARTFTGTDWSQLGRAITYGIANGLLLGLPNLLAMATRIATSLLTTIKRSLGISSPSKAFMALGLASAQGYQLGLARAMSPEDIARSVTRPVNQLAASSQQNITMNFASGLTTRDVSGMIQQNNDILIAQLNRAMAGA